MQKKQVFKLTSFTDPTILIVTTSGCESCTIIENIIKEILRENNLLLSINLKIIDKVSLSKSFLKINKITDFPTVFFIDNENIKYKFTGIYPKIVIDRWIRINLL